MRNLILKMSMSIDGFVADEHGKGDWMARSRDEESSAYVLGVVSRASTHLFGRKAWQMLTAFWPTAPGPFAAPMNTIPKMVFTQAGIELPAERPANEALRSWTHPRVASGNLVEEINRLKAEPGGEILAQGGAAFARALIANDLVDEYVLAIHPIVLGRGMPIFTDAKPKDLQLVDVKRFSKTVVHVYRRG